MSPNQLTARISRLQFLAMRLRKEHHRIGTNYGMNLEECQYYAAAIWDAAKALGRACIPLGSTLRRDSSCWNPFC
jgi:hypothetical protein